MKKKILSAAVREPTVKTLVQKIVEGEISLSVRKGKKIFLQAEISDAIYFIETGRLKISVISSAGKEATPAILGPPSFVGEGCLVGQALRVATATAAEAATLFRIDTDTMLHALSEQPDLANYKMPLISNDF